MHHISNRSSIVLVASSWNWVMESLVVDHSALASAKSYRGCLQLIKEAESNPGMKTGDGRLDAMIGMALCRPALLQSKSPRNALELLDVYQLRAISSWHRAQLSDKAI
jgi:hypothetical protein